MYSHFTVTLLVATLLSAQAQAASTTHTSPGASAPAGQRISEASGVSRATDLKAERTGQSESSSAAATVNARLLAIASRVLVGLAACEFKQIVSLSAVRSTPGHFDLTFKNRSYLMVPEETSTGAVRLVDHQSGMVWLQIPAKSMLLNQKTGQRIVDECRHPAQWVSAGAV